MFGTRDMKGKRKGNRMKNIFSCLVRDEKKEVEGYQNSPHFGEPFSFLIHPTSLNQTLCKRREQDSSLVEEYE